LTLSHALHIAYVILTALKKVQILAATP